MEQTKRIALIGGGRWAGEIADTLRMLLSENERLCVVSPSNPGIWLARRRLENVFIEPVGHVETICKNPEISAVFIARAARDHASTARTLLQAGKSVFVEKPFALSMAEAKTVIAAIRPDCVCLTGLTFLYAKNLLNFVYACQELGQLQSLRLEWSDATEEIRRGQSKRYDANIGVIEDVLPHVWSILRLFEQRQPLIAKEARIEAKGNAAWLRLSLGSVDTVVSLLRDSNLRRRWIEVTSEGGTAKLDFAQEPGIAVRNGRELSVQEGYTSPLRRELSHFLSVQAGRAAPGLADVRYAVESIALAEVCNSIAVRE